MKTKFNKSQIFKKAWSLFKIEITKNQDNRTDQIFSECLKQAWKIAKTMPVINITELYKLHYGAIFNFINMKLHNTEVSEELTNDVFLKASEKMYLFNSDKSKLLTWLYTIAKNLVIDYYRADNSDKYINVSQFNDAETGKEIFQFADSQTTDSIMDNKELLANVQKAMSKLKPKYQKVAELHFIADKPYQEIADLLQMPLGSVKGVVSRIRVELQNNLSYVRSIYA
jgi:RNA polymerase sigma-70 factor (ECF subfamily)